MFAARCGFTNLALMLLRRRKAKTGVRVNINAQDRSDRTALYLACEQGHNDIAQALIAGITFLPLKIFGETQC